MVLHLKPQPYYVSDATTADPADALRDAENGEENGLLQVTGAEPAEISRVLGENGLWVERLVPSRRGLEQIFLELTQGEGLPAPPGRPTAPSGEEAR